MAKLSDEFANIIGLSFEEAKASLIKSGVKHVRVMEKNGEHFIGTMDYRLDRVNLKIQDDKVYQASRG